MSKIIGIIIALLSRVVWFFIGYYLGNKKVTNITCTNVYIEKPEYKEEAKK